MIREYIEDIIDEVFIREDISALAKSIFLGNRKELSEGIKSLFVDTGQIHLLAISGLHMNIIILGLLFFSSIININYRVKYIMTFIIISLYTLLLGFSASIMRSYIMISIYLISKIFLIEIDKLKSLILAFIIILFIDVNMINDIGFILSFIASFSLVYIVPKYRTDSIVLNSIIASFIIQTLSTGVFIKYFSKIYIFAFLLNIITIPIFTLIIPLIFITVIFNVIHINIFNELLVFIITFLYKSIIFIIYYFNEYMITFVQINWNIPVTLIRLIYVILLSIFLFKKSKNILE